MSFDLFGGRRLLLAGARLGWFWVAVGAVALALLVVLYREERRLVSRRAGLVLLGLRLAAGGVLVLALFEPIAARSTRETVRGRVIVAVDVSESMATADPGRPAADRARLAGVLRLSPGERVETLPRREVARRLVESNGSPIGRIAAGHAVEAVAFAREAAPTTREGLALALRRPGQPDDPSRLTTDWEPVLAAALRDGPAPVLGVVLLTDGRQNAPSDPGPTADRLAARGIPVYPLLIGSTVPPRDAAIAAVRAPEAVYQGDVASISATLKLDGYAGQEVDVTVERPGAEPQRQTVVAPADGSRPVVSFRVPMARAGAVPLTIAVEPRDGGSGSGGGDVRPDNDRRTVTVQVADDKAAVLLVDGEARWEFRYLRNALARDPGVKVAAVVLHQPEATGVSARFTYETALPPRLDTASAVPDPLGTFDAIVLGDVDPADLPADAWARLESYVAERGGTLILNPGPRSWSALALHETARKLLPVLDPRPVAVGSGARDRAHPSLAPGSAVVPVLAARSDAAAWPMLQLASEPEQNLAVWTGLPRLPWVLAGRAKPGATPLASARGNGDGNGDGDGDERASAGAIALAAQPYGLGKVLWVGTDGTWRWRHRVGDAYHHRFWGQSVRWASSGKLAAGNAFVRFGPVRSRVPEGEGARLQARIAEGVAGAGPDLLIAARIFRATGEPEGPGQAEAVAVVPLRALAGQPRTYDGTAPPLPPGTYVVRLDVPSLAGPLGLLGGQGADVPHASLEVTTRETTERIELAAARDPVARLAAATGGRVFADFEADALPPLLRSRTRQVVRTEEVPLWDHPGALLLFVAILTAEWVARKQAGLP